MAFTIDAVDGKARAGVLSAPSGRKVQTPFFMPVLTRAVGKYVDAHDYEALGVEASISNSLLLHFRPGEAVVEEMGGLNQFMNSRLFTFTDCGGFQVASESMQHAISKRGIRFRNPYSGVAETITPERIMQIQQRIGADVAMAFDDMAPYGSTRERFEHAAENTLRWHTESLAHHERNKQLLFGIVQGGFHPNLRERCAKEIVALGFDGYAIGGVAIGEPTEEMHAAVDAALPHLPLDKTRYVMGVGSPEELVELVCKGVDCFDSIYPTQNARHNTLFTDEGRLLLDKACYATDKRPIDPACTCPVCRTHTRAYLHHLMKVDAAMGKRLRSIHNVAFIIRLMAQLREAIEKRALEGFKRRFLRHYPC